MICVCVQTPKVQPSHSLVAAVVGTNVVAFVRRTIEIDRFHTSRLLAHPVRTHEYKYTRRWRGVGIIICCCCCCCAANFHRKSAAEVINLATPRRPRPSTGRSVRPVGKKADKRGAGAFFEVTRARESHANGNTAMGRWVGAPVCTVGRVIYC